MDMIYNIFFDVLSAWQVIAVGLLIMIVLPIVFYFASFDKSPVKIKRVPANKKSGTTGAKKQKAKQGDEGAEEEEEEGEEEEAVPEDKKRGKNSRRQIIDDNEEAPEKAKKGSKAPSTKKSGK